MAWGSAAAIFKTVEDGRGRADVARLRDEIAGGCIGENRRVVGLVKPVDDKKRSLFCQFEGSAPLSFLEQGCVSEDRQYGFGRSSPVILRVKDLRRVPSPPAKMTPHSCLSCLDSPVGLSVPARSIMVTSFKAVWKLWIRILIRNTREDPISCGGISSFEHLRHDQKVEPRW